MPAFIKGFFITLLLSLGALWFWDYLYGHRMWVLRFPLLMFGAVSAFALSLFVGFISKVATSGYKNPSKVFWALIIFVVGFFGFIFISSFYR